ncbi:unnamed protein product [Tenebrio molitor]|nr:unnamed protein product [Tenebrio molitor]
MVPLGWKINTCISWSLGRKVIFRSPDPGENTDEGPPQQGKT